MTEHTHITDITFYRDDSSGVVWVDRSGDLPFTEGGNRGEIASLRIEVGVDGFYTIVEHQQADRAALGKVISDLQYLVERLDAVYLPDEPRGRCLEFGDWGRCHGSHGHDEHNFPTEEDWRRSQPSRPTLPGVTEVTPVR